MRDRFAPRHYGDKYFFAVLPDPETAVKIAAYADRLREAVRAARQFHSARASPCHALPGYITPNMMALLKEAAEHTEMQPFDLMFDHVISYPSSRALVSCGGGNEGAVGRRHLHAAIGKVMAAVGCTTSGLRRDSPRISV